MSFHVNNVVIGGYISHDQELRTTPSGKKVTDLRIGIDAEDKNDKDKSYFIQVAVWGATAESVCRWLKKGSPLVVIGRLIVDEWTDKESGAKRSRTKVLAERVQFLPKVNG